MGRFFTGSLREDIIERDEGKCAYGDIFNEQSQCTDTTHIDHENSWSNGGDTTADNGITSCSYHNQEKGSDNALNYIWDKSGPS